MGEKTQGTSRDRDSLLLSFLHKSSSTRWSISFFNRSSGFFLRLDPTRLTFAAGMIDFQKARLASYREQVLDDDRGNALAAIVRGLRTDGCLVGGETYKRTPRGVPAEHPRAALTKHSALFATLVQDHPPELATAAFVDFCFTQFARLAPVHA